MAHQRVLQTTQAGAALQAFLAERRYSMIGVLVDDNTKVHCYPLLEAFLPSHEVMTIPPGEEKKNLQTCAAIWQAMTDWSFDRKAALVNLGGGVIGDMGGFCAATFKRGIDFINIPTTLLAQVDASIGGKLGVDFESFKNHIGVFKDPDLVIVDPGFLKTLDKRELRSGFAEVIKHALIADAAYWPKIAGQRFEDQDWKGHIAHSISIKEKVVAQDPKESGLRKILNFGHTIGHAIESYFLNVPGEKALHGEAIAIGMICEAWLSVSKTGADAGEMNDIAKYLLNVYGKKEIHPDAWKKIAMLTIQDKKNVNREVRASLLSAIGRCEYDVLISEQDILAALEFYQSL